MLTIITNYRHNQIKANYIKLSGIEKINLREGNIIPPSEISVNGNLLSKSSSSYNTKDVVNFIRNIQTKNDYYYISTAVDDNGNYDTYLVPFPEEKVSDALDKLYSMLVTDLRMQNNSRPETRDIDLEELGFKDDIDNQYTISIPMLNIMEKLEYKNKMIETNQEYLLRYPSFLKQFQFIEGPVFSKAYLTDTLAFYQTIPNKKITKLLEKQVKSATENANITRSWTKLAKNLTIENNSNKIIKSIEQNTTLGDNK